MITIIHGHGFSKSVSNFLQSPITNGFKLHHGLAFLPPFCSFPFPWISLSENGKLVRYIIKRNFFVMTDNNCKSFSSSSLRSDSGYTQAANHVDGGCMQPDRHEKEPSPTLYVFWIKKKTNKKKHVHVMYWRDGTSFFQNIFPHLVF